MTDNPSPPPSGNVISLRIEGEFADAVDRIAQDDGVSRSEVVRRMLIGNLDSEVHLAVRWIRQLGTIHDQLVDMLKVLDDAEAVGAAAAIQEAIEWIDSSIDQLEDFEPDED